MLIILLLGIIVFIIFNVRKLKLFREHLFSNAVKVMLFISVTQYYAPVEVCRAVEDIHLLKITLKLHP